MKSFLKKIYWPFLAILIIVLDQFSKRVVVSNVEYRQEIPLIKNFFYITYWKNDGIAFGFLSEHGNAAKILVALLTSALIIAALIALVKKWITHPLGVLSLAFIIGGGIGNLIDRIFLHYVVDFIGLIFFGWRFAVFNVADIFVTCGTILLMIYFIFLDKKDDEKLKDEPSGNQDIQNN